MITVINIIPNSLSGELNQDSEPNIAVNPADPNHIAISAFTPDPLGGANAPVFISEDGGATWNLNSIVPSSAGSSSGTGDITTRFAGRSGKFYAGILRDPGWLRLNILRTSGFSSSATMAVLVDRNNVDQPYIQASTVMAGPDAGKDRIYVGLNDFAPTDGKTATIDQSLDAGATTPTFTSVRLEHRPTVGQDGPQIRPVTHPDGTVYAIFYGWRAFSATNVVTADVIVVRDDNWGTGSAPFTALVDPSDGVVGRCVANNVNFTCKASYPQLGQDRIMGDLAIAVDPNNSSIVYIAFCDVQSGSYTIHIRRSQDRGLTWTPDLKNVSNAKNPVLAINSRGAVGLAYQRVVTSGGIQRWETHFELTVDAFASSTDSVLASVPANTPIQHGFPYIGDYMGMMAVGKDFFGVFSANNTPDQTNFPNGVTYFRNHNFTTKKLLAVDGVSEVAPSIDPFFFKVSDNASSTDQYIRDWTDSPKDHDTGVEPSSNPWFYVNPDVWNRRSNAPGAFNANDQPVNQDPQTAAFGSNFAFCRVSRNASGSVENATVHFLYSEFGTGSNYQDANVTPDPAITFAAGDTVQILANGYAWQLPATSSTHLCLAAELDSPNDRLKLPSLIGRAPGWPTTDLIVINDNNKAQRNMGIYPTPGGAKGSISLYAIVHNGAYFRRNIELLLDAPEAVRPLLKDAVIEIVGKSGKLQIQPFSPRSRVVLEEMLPGANAWIGVTLQVPKAKPGTLFPLLVSEVVDGKVINGFAIAPQVSTAGPILQGALDLHAGTFHRIAESFGLATAKDEGAAALKLARNPRLRTQSYLTFMKRRVEPRGKAVDELLSMKRAPDVFGVGNAHKNLLDAMEGGDTLAVAAAHTTLVHKLDAYVTMLQKAQGDAADILQMVGWQLALFSGLAQTMNLPAIDTVIGTSKDFIAAYEARKIDNMEYPRLLEHLLDAFVATADALKLDAAAELDTIKQALPRPLSTLQKAHRAYLLKLPEGKA